MLYPTLERKRVLYQLAVCVYCLQQLSSFMNLLGVRSPGWVNNVHDVSGKFSWKAFWKLLRTVLGNTR